MDEEPTRTADLPERNMYTRPHRHPLISGTRSSFSSPSWSSSAAAGSHRAGPQQWGGTLVVGEGNTPKCVIRHIFANLLFCLNTKSLWHMFTGLKLMVNCSQQFSMIIEKKYSWFYTGCLVTQPIKKDTVSYSLFSVYFNVSLGNLLTPKHMARLE